MSFVVRSLRVDFREGRESFRVVMETSMAASSEGVAVSAGSYIGAVIRRSVKGRGGEGRGRKGTNLDRPEDPLTAAIFLGCFSFDETVLLHLF